MISSLYTLETNTFNTLNRENKRDPVGTSSGETSLEIEKDMSVCSDINERKRTGMEFGVKYFVILVIPKDVSEGAIEERIQYIKRSCALDKSNLFLLYESWNQEEIKKLIFKYFLLYFSKLILYCIVSLNSY